MVSHEPLKTQNQDPFDNSPALLNIVFFRARGEVGSLRLKTWQWKGLILATGFILLWTTLSVFYLLSLQSKLTETQNNLRDSQRVIFEYQSRYNGVYEQAYPEHHQEPPPATLPDFANEEKNNPPQPLLGPLTPPLSESRNPEEK